MHPLRTKYAQDLGLSLQQFKRQFPYHNDLDLIDTENRVTVGEGRKAIPQPRVRQLVKARLVDIIDGPFGEELQLTSVGKTKLRESREVFSEL